MVKKSTPLGLAFFSLVLAGFVVVQYCWMKSLQDDKLRDFRTRTLSAIADLKEKIPLTGSRHEWSDSVIGTILYQSFSSRGLGDIHFEYFISSSDNRLASHGFTQKMTTDSANLILYHQLLPNDQHMPSDALLTVVIPA